MHRTLLFAKIHNCTLTEVNPNYVGSITIAQLLLEKAGILPYGQFTSEEIKSFSPTVVIVDDKNKLLEVRHYDSLLGKTIM